MSTPADPDQHEVPQPEPNDVEGDVDDLPRSDRAQDRELDE